MAVLLLMAVLLILGMALLSQKSSEYEAAIRSREAAQARALAQAGLEDARIKMAKDLFPPLNLPDDEDFAYSEDFTDLDGTFIGSFAVTLNRRLAEPPHAIIQITSLGEVGPRDQPRATFQVYAEVDVSRQDRMNPPNLNPDYGRWANYLEQATPDESALP